MKRSQINQILADAAAFIAQHGQHLPGFANWSPEDLVARVRSDARQIMDRRLGWDITDYGAGRFDEMGLFLFTTRNGDLSERDSGTGMLYAEKIMISRRDQLSPMHTHVHKVEDIINRGGATLAIELFGSDDAGNFAQDRGCTVACDGIARTVAPGDKLMLAPGESVTLRPGDWHAFWGEGGDVLIGEVSTVNDDLTDNIFREPIGRFATIEADVVPTHLLVSDYDEWVTRG